MSYFNAAYERKRQDQMTPDAIMAIARRAGSFRVSLRYRDEWLNRRCRKLKAKGLLVGGRVHQGEHVYYLAAEPEKAALQPEPEKT
jgi:hypothetical protein